MYCPRCQSEYINVQIVNETSIKQKKHGCLWWAFVGWWLEPILWIYLTVPRLLYAIFHNKKYVAENKRKAIYTCQSCGYYWE